QDISQTHLLKKLIARCAHPFSEALRSNNVDLTYKDIELINIRTDFRLFNCAVYHFFENIVKYIRPDSQITVSVNSSLDELNFEMMSRAIETEESNLIFSEGFCGKYSGREKVEGLGMYIFSLILSKMKATPSVKWEENTRLITGDYPYQKNIFSIKMVPGVMYKS
ncbi:MAG: hypothetical protein Q7K45_06665, partial [Nanoarchaeota archaeon]|nr:hypothetical protein [Nanoarchaeota archaeon]